MMSRLMLHLHASVDDGVYTTRADVFDTLPLELTSPQYMTTMGVGERDRDQESYYGDI
jgi:hypothetical protein